MNQPVYHQLQPSSPFRSLLTPLWGSLDPFNTQCLAGGLTASEPAALGCLDAAPAEPGAAAPTLLPGAGAPTAAGAARAAAPGPGGGPAPPPAAGPRWQDLRGRGSAAHDILANKQ